MSEYFTEPKYFGKVKVGLELSNYVTKKDLKNASGIDTSSFAKKVDLTNLKYNVDKLDIDKLKNLPTNLDNLKSKIEKLNDDKLVPAPVDLGKIIDVVKNDVVKRNVYNSMIKNIEDKTPDITNLATKTTLNAKTNEVKGEIPSITNLATKNILNVVDYNTKINCMEQKITDHNHDKYITTLDFNKLTSENFAARLKQVNLASKIEIANFVKKIDFHNQVRNVTSNKNELNEL